MRIGVEPPLNFSLPSGHRLEISAIADDTIKFERIVAWCVAHPDEVPFALHQLMRRSQES